MPERPVEEVILGIVRRFGRRGINEAIIWTMVAGERDVSIDVVTAAVERMVAAGRLYRDRRRTRTMIHVDASYAGDVPAVAAPPVSPDAQSALF